MPPDPRDEPGDRPVDGGDRSEGPSARSAGLGDRSAGLGRPLVIGITGGIASGKSAVACLLVGSQGLVLAADAIAHEVLASDEVRSKVAAAFGPECLDADGQPDRAALAQRIFGDEEARRRLEGWIHPLVRARILERLNEAGSAGVPRVALDVPLLWENDEQHGFSRLCDAIVFVDSDADERDRRARETRGWTAGEVARREASQLALDEKRQRADFVLINRGGLEELEQAVRDLSDQLDRRSR